MFQSRLFMDDYDVEQVQKQALLLSDMRDITHATIQGYSAVLLAMSNLDECPVDVTQVLTIVESLQQLSEVLIDRSSKILSKANYRGEK